MTNEAKMMNIDAGAWKKWREWLNSPAGNTTLKKCAASVIWKAKRDGISLAHWTDLADEDSGQQRTIQESVTTQLWLLLAGASESSTSSPQDSSKTVNAVDEATDIGAWLKGLIQASSALSQAELEQRIVRKALNVLKDFKRTKKGDPVSFRYRGIREAITAAIEEGGDFTSDLDEASNSFFFAACRENDLQFIYPDRFADANFDDVFPEPEHGRAPTTSKKFILKIAPLFWNKCVEIVKERGLVPGQTFAFAMVKRYGAAEGSPQKDQSLEDIPDASDLESPRRESPFRLDLYRCQSLADDLVSVWPQPWRDFFILRYEKDMPREAISKALFAGNLAQANRVEKRIKKSIEEKVSSHPELEPTHDDPGCGDHFFQALKAACENLPPQP